MILVFGSLNVDFIFDLEALPTPGQTLLARGLTVAPGGKGANQALAARRAGAEVVLVGAVGRDPLADVALRNLRAEGVDVARVSAVDWTTGCASLVIDAAGANQIVVAPGANGLAKASQVDDALLARATHLVLQGESDRVEVETLIERAKDADVQVVLNLAPAVPLAERALRLLDLLIVNEDESAQLAARLRSEASAKGLHIALGVDVVRTLGSAGSEAATLDGLFHVPAPQVAAIDTTGAGDVFVGALAASLARGDDLVPAMRFASAAAAQACLVQGGQG